MQSTYTHAKRFNSRASRTKHDIVVEAVTLEDSFRATFRYNRLPKNPEVKEAAAKAALEEFDIAVAALRAELTRELSK